MMLGDELRNAVQKAYEASREEPAADETLGVALYAALHGN
jgi:hypothetical protein